MKKVVIRIQPEEVVDIENINENKWYVLHVNKNKIEVPRLYIAIYGKEFGWFFQSTSLPFSRHLESIYDSRSSLYDLIRVALEFNNNNLVFEFDSFKEASEYINKHQ